MLPGIFPIGHPGTAQRGWSGVGPADPVGWNCLTQAAIA